MNAEKAIYLVQACNLLAFVLVAMWFVVPRLREISRVDALIALVSIHLGRTLCLQIYSSQDAGFRVPDDFRDHVVLGDMAGWALAVIILICLHYRSRLAVPLIWVLISETVLDLASSTFEGIRGGAIASANGTTWLIVAFYVPVMQVALGLTIWQLLVRRNERLAG